MMGKTFRLFLTAAAALAASPAMAGPSFILTDVGGVGAGTQARAGFEAAAALWSSVLSNNVTIRLNVGFQALSSGILGQTNSTEHDYRYSAVRSALTAGQTSATDQKAVATLGTSLSFRSNEAGNCTTGVGCLPISKSSRTLDNDNTYDNNNLTVTNANAKALGLLADNSSVVDASIVFSNKFKWDFDGSDGITTGFFDFVGIAAHEIGHSLGFESGVDLADANVGSYGLDSIAWGSVLDLFRYYGKTRDWTIGTASCFTVTPGTCTARMATGVYNGDGRQASHFKDNLRLGIMDPTANYGEKLQLTDNDLMAFDSIGWNLSSGASTVRVSWNGSRTIPVVTGGSSSAVPAPASLALMGGALSGLALLRRARRG